MVVIRPVNRADLEPLHELAALAGVGLTTLPKDRDLLGKRITKSLRSFENIPDRPGGESYLFVMQDVDTGRVVGASGVISKVGGFEPFYAYRVEKEVFDCKLLNSRQVLSVLHLVRDHNGPAEIGSLFLAPDYRRKDNGRLLQLVRFLFIAEHREAFEQTVVSELRGVIDSNGRSAFWEAVGKHFFNIDFPQADYLSVVNKRFIADLLPVHPLYVQLLPRDAQEVIGKVHEQSKPALKNLEAEGFTFNGMVDIFDAGACVSCPRDQIRTVRDSRAAVVESLVEDGSITSPTYMIGAVDSEFRAVRRCALLSSDRAVQIEKRCADAMQLRAGQRVCIAPLRPAKTSDESGMALKRSGAGGTND